MSRRRTDAVDLAWQDIQFEKHLESLQKGHQKQQPDPGRAPMKGFNFYNMTGRNRKYAEGAICPMCSYGKVTVRNLCNSCYQRQRKEAATFSPSLGE